MTLPTRVCVHANPLVRWLDPSKILRLIPARSNEVMAELAAAKNPMGASDQPVTVTDRDPSFTASEWGSKEEE